ncbi:MAG: GAF domain-containing protein, partial [Qipengyuania sp.]
MRTFGLRPGSDPIADVILSRWQTAPSSNRQQGETSILGLFRLGIDRLIDDDRVRKALAAQGTSPMQMVDKLQSKEDQRMAAVRRYDILDSPPDGAFDRITALAARRLNVPIAIISIVDEDRIWFKSHHGLPVEQIDREPGLCASAIMKDAPYLIEDARKDPRSLANPLVAGEFGLRFYAAVPLTTGDGHNLGTLCV